MNGIGFVVGFYTSKITIYGHCIYSWSRPKQILMEELNDLFDEDFNLLDRHFFGTTATYRPHLLFVDHYLYMGYDIGISVEKIKLSRIK